MLTFDLGKLSSADGICSESAVLIKPKHCQVIAYHRICKLEWIRFHFAKPFARLAVLIHAKTVTKTAAGLMRGLCGRSA